MYGSVIAQKDGVVSTVKISKKESFPCVLI